MLHLLNKINSLGRQTSLQYIHDPLMGIEVVWLEKCKILYSHSLTLLIILFFMAYNDVFFFVNRVLAKIKFSKRKNLSIDKS